MKDKENKTPVTDVVTGVLVSMNLPFRLLGVLPQLLLGLSCAIPPLLGL